jgi:O-antigen/teichoic acid export membrane protein
MISGNTLCVVAERVLFPFFSRIQQDVEALQKVYAKSLFLGGLSFAIVLSFMAANAEDLIVLLFGELWVPSANYFVVLCAFAFVYVFHRVVLLYVKSQGAGALLVRLTIVEQLLVLFTISVSVQFGIMLMLWCMVFSSAIALIVKYYILYKHYGCSFGLQLKQTCMPILVGYGLWWLAGQQMYANQAHPLLCILESACFVLCGLGSCLLIYTCACRREWLKIRSISQLKGAFKTVLE